MTDDEIRALAQALVLQIPERKVAFEAMRPLHQRYWLKVARAAYELGARAPTAPGPYDYDPRDLVAFGLRIVGERAHSEPVLWNSAGHVVKNRSGYTCSAHRCASECIAS